MQVRFFVTGMGRSGTKWLANLLNEDSDTLVRHEPLKKFDAQMYGLVYRGIVDPYAYLRKRSELMCDGWAEVNSYLRYVTPELVKIFKAPVLGLIRDGRYTVRSIYNRLGKKGILFSSPYRDTFEAVCWYWADCYERLNIPIYCLEDLNRDWNVFQELCACLKLEIPERVWKKHVGVRKNLTPNLGKDLRWTSSQHETFNRIAGSTQRKFYEAQKG